MSTQPDQAVQRIVSIVQRRANTDRKMGYHWMIVPLLPVLAGIGIGIALVGVIVSAIPKITSISQPQTVQTAQNLVAPILVEVLALYGGAIILLYAALLLGALGFYSLIDRRTRHFTRQQLLFSTLQEYLASKAPAGENITRLRQLSEDSVYEERDRPAGLWAVLFLFVSPIIGLLASYNLTQDMRKHDELQSNYQTTLVNALGEAGLQPPAFTPYKSHKRDPVLFIILSAITGGLFWIYWFYTLLKDYNEHFTDQAKFEDQLLNLLKPQGNGKPCVTCGGRVPAAAKFCPSCGTQQPA